MNTHRYRTALIAAAMFAGGSVVTGCTTTGPTQSTGEYLDDSVVTAKVKAALVEDKTVSALNVNVETFNGVVQLSGFANSQAELEQASVVARSVPGVRNVKNDIRLKSAAD